MAKPATAPNIFRDLAEQKFGVTKRNDFVRLISKKTALSTGMAYRIWDKPDQNFERNTIIELATLFEVSPLLFFKE